MSHITTRGQSSGAESTSEHAYKQPDMILAAKKGRTMSQSTNQWRIDLIVPRTLPGWTIPLWVIKSCTLLEAKYDWGMGTRRGSQMSTEHFSLTFQFT
ncbi:hypothetical protein MPTK1_8g10840 [Marchantia polymorpha subsp. ruderalis]|uniref:Uncharacterized protein n=1 Tax=Marchantia polymorpha TaxID=3197 RepID=A0A2R6XMN4_MARPO|nr:hypothetical protein MARPO_0008s0138 [Marchantia polymorpha]BBN19458.1 hypothetical protein Mp_8g10840 [Marchantia polymorpha subsp. ruderalis]|eukprot:PTQ47373.1 hypothetical protein MARPO_0008s0138 [Marchantia polymorpha]